MQTVQFHSVFMMFHRSYKFIHLFMEAKLIQMKMSVQKCLTIVNVQSLLLFKAPILTYTRKSLKLTEESLWILD